MLVREAQGPKVVVLIQKLRGLMRTNSVLLPQTPEILPIF
jgi:hypothetical protein